MFPREEQGVIYKLTSPSGKSYIGQTWEMLSNGDHKGTQGRWRQHINTAKLGKIFPICHAIRKYGEESFTVETLVRTHKDFLDMYEELCIKVCDTLVPRGYNVQTGGHNSVRTYKSKQRRSETMKAMLKNTEMRVKWSKAKQGKRQNGTRRKKRPENEGLPKYVMYYQYKQYKGYEVQYTPPEIPVRITKKFTKSKLSMDEKLRLAIEFVMELHEEYGTIVE